MNLGRPRTPTSVLELKGAFKHNPDRALARIDEPELTGAIGDPPEGMTEAQVACWNELLWLRGPGVLFRCHRVVLEQLASVLAEARERKWQISMALHARLQSLLCELGMTPASNSKVKAVKKADVDSPLDEFNRAA